MKTTKVKDMTITQVVNLMITNLARSGETGIQFKNALFKTGIDCKYPVKPYIEMLYTKNEKLKKDTGYMHIYRMYLDEEYILSDNVRLAEEVFRGF